MHVDDAANPVKSPRASSFTVGTEVVLPRSGVLCGIYDPPCDSHEQLISRDAFKRPLLQRVVNRISGDACLNNAWPGIKSLDFFFFFDGMPFLAADLRRLFHRMRPTAIESSSKSNFEQSYLNLALFDSNFQIGNRRFFQRLF
jgi:hypothetical protein